jgi:hypothetical protein
MNWACPVSFAAIQYSTSQPRELTIPVLDAGSDLSEN